MPRLIVQVRATKDSETGVPPSADIMLQMLAYNKSLSEAGVISSANGLLSSSNGTRISFDGSGNTTVTLEPFDLGTVMSGYWIFEANDLKDATRWGGRRQWGGGGVGSKVSEPEDFGEQAPAEVKAAHAELGKKIG